MVLIFDSGNEGLKRVSCCALSTPKEGVMMT